MWGSVAAEGACADEDLPESKERHGADCSTRLGCWKQAESKWYQASGGPPSLCGAAQLVWSREAGAAPVAGCGWWWCWW